jgi:hypothetical protein
MGIEGVTEARNPWLPYHEFLTKQTAHLVGAKETRSREYEYTLRQPAFDDGIILQTY